MSVSIRKTRYPTLVCTADPYCYNRRVIDVGNQQGPPNVLQGWCPECALAIRDELLRLYPVEPPEPEVREVYLCPVCGKQYEYKMQLVNHLRNHHGMELPEPADEEPGADG